MASGLASVPSVSKGLGFLGAAALRREISGLERRACTRRPRLACLARHSIRKNPDELTQLHLNPFRVASAAVRHETLEISDKQDGARRTPPTGGVSKALLCRLSKVPVTGRV